MMGYDTWGQKLGHPDPVAVSLMGIFLLDMLFTFFQEYGIPKHFGLFYAMGIALMMEGVLSACYHVCPNYSNFQFGN